MITHFYCTECGKTYKADVNINIDCEDSNLIHHTALWYRCECGEHAANIDSGLIDIIQKLNSIGLTTEFCCEGHVHIYDGETEYSSAYILFNDQITMETFNDIIGKIPLPSGWNININEVDNDNRVCIRYDKISIEDLENMSDNVFNFKKQSYLKSLSEWVNNIMNIKLGVNDYDRT